jgi:hypothetical protein
MFTGYQRSAVKAPVVDGANVIERFILPLDAKGLERPKTCAIWTCTSKFSLPGGWNAMRCTDWRVANADVLRASLGACNKGRRAARLTDQNLRVDLPDIEKHGLAQHPIESRFRRWHLHPLDVRTGKLEAVVVQDVARLHGEVKDDCVGIDLSGLDTKGLLGGQELLLCVSWANECGEESD